MSKRWVASAAAVVLVVGLWWFLSLQNSNPEGSPPDRRPNQVIRDVPPERPIEPIELTLETAPFVAPVERVQPSRLRILDALSDRPLHGVILTFGETRSDGIAETNRDGIVELVADLKDKVRAVATLPESFGGSAFELSWSEGIEKDPANEAADATFEVRLPAYARLRMEITGFDLALADKLVVQVAPLPPLPPESDPGYVLAKLERDVAPIVYSNSYERERRGAFAFAQSEVRRENRFWIAEIPFSGEVGVQVSLRGFLTKSFVGSVVQGAESSASLRLEPTLFVRGTLKLDGVPVQNEEVRVTCATVLTPGELVAFGDAERAGLAICHYTNTNRIEASTMRMARTNAEGQYFAEVPFVDRIAVSAFGLNASNRTAFHDSRGARISLELDVNASSAKRASDRMRLLDDATGEPLAGQRVTTAVVDDPFWISYPERFSDAEGWFEISDILERKGGSFPIVFMVDRDGGASQRFDRDPEPGATLRVK